MVSSFRVLGPGHVGRRGAHGLQAARPLPPVRARDGPTLHSLGEVSAYSKLVGLTESFNARVSSSPIFFLMPFADLFKIR